MVRSSLYAVPLVVSLLLSGHVLRAQERCGTVPYTQRLQQHRQLPEDATFELWLAQRIEAGRSARTQQGPYQIPVVVHVIHNGEPIGDGANISEAQILSQLQVLNEDFRRTNPDATNTPPEFATVAGNLDIEFVLAKQDPEGLATDGIVRVQGSKSIWSMDDNYQLKAHSYWPAEDYLNIWVANLSTYLGWGQLPVGNLQGLENSSNNRLTDGIVIWYRAFGSNDHGDFDLSAEFSKGRTTTHEAGHFLGLRHIWGDDGGGCFGSDYVDDTPNQSGQTSGCPDHPREDACGGNRMFQNFMDYSSDACMNLFTQGQVERMIAVLENSPRRNSLLTSPGLVDPIPVPNDLGLRRIENPAASHCQTMITPVIEVRNYGSNTITETTIRLHINGIEQETAVFNISLAPLATMSVSFSGVGLTPGLYDLSFGIVSTNGTADGNVNNNTLSGSVRIPAPIGLPFSEEFNALPNDWVIHNPDQNVTWEIATAPRESNNNLALRLNHFNYTDGFGEYDVLYSPVFDLSQESVASLIFQVAHARYGASFDQLQVVALVDCEPLSEGTVIYDKSGSALATATATTSTFVPSGVTDWRREQVNLSTFTGVSHLQLAFVSISDWGNNLYVDDISVIITEFDDLGIAGVVSPSPVTCETTSPFRITVQNFSIGNVDSFEVYYQVNDDDAAVVSFTDVGFEDASSRDFDLPPLTLREGENTIVVALRNPNGTPDDNTSNDSIFYHVIVNQARDRLPLRVHFGEADGWTSVNPFGGMSWETVELASGTAVAFYARVNEQDGDQAWLVSPTLDFSNTLEASMVFDISYRRRSGNHEKLEVMVSTDCGQTFAPLTEYTLPSFSRGEFWVPETPIDWMTDAMVNLQTLAGEKDARVAFRVTNDHGNNLYIDSVEFFVTAIPNLLAIEAPYSIYGYDGTDPSATQLKLIFNLPARTDVAFSVTDMMGQTFARGMIRDVLNQTWTLPLEGLASGVYVVRLKIGERYYTDRILVSH